MYLTLIPCLLPKRLSTVSLKTPSFRKQSRTSLQVRSSLFLSLLPQRVKTYLVQVSLMTAQTCLPPPKGVCHPSGFRDTSHIHYTTPLPTISLDTLYYPIFKVHLCSYGLLIVRCRFSRSSSLSLL